MGFLDKLIGRKAAAAPATPGAPAAARAAAPAPMAVSASGKNAPTGPLRLSKGDFVTHYRERFAVVGHRVLEGDGGTVLHYCLRDKDGNAAVLACDGGADGALSLQLAVKAEVKWDADVVEGVAETPLRVVAKGRAKVRGWDDSGLAADVRSVEFRRFADKSGDLTLCAEDYQGRREVRLGQSVLEAELEFERGSGAGGGAMTAAMSRARAFEEAKDDDVVRGTPRAAAKALEKNMGTRVAAAKGAAADRDPAAYDDEKWIDAVDEQPAVKPRPPAPRDATAEILDEEDEWSGAAAFVREKGAAAAEDSGRAK
jgi:hypothetical protein